MPQTGAERNKKYREKIKSNAELSATYKEKDRQRKRKAEKIISVVQERLPSRKRKLEIG